MTYLVTNCFHWIGFHLTNTLIKEGFEVVGLDNLQSEKKENLSLFFGRNSLFSYVEEEQKLKSYEFEAAFQFNLGSEWKKIRASKIKRSLLLTSNQPESLDTEPFDAIVKIPMMFGEWMSRDSNGFYYRDNYVKFDSDQFQNEAIYINDFVQSIIQLANSKIVPKEINFKPLRTSTNQNRENNNFLFIRDLESINSRVNKVEDHYKQYSQFY